MPFLITYPPTELQGKCVQPKLTCFRSKQTVLHYL